MSQRAQEWFDQSGLPEMFRRIRQRQLWEVYWAHFWQEIDFVVVTGLFFGNVQFTRQEEDPLSLWGELR